MSDNTRRVRCKSFTLEYQPIYRNLIWLCLITNVNKLVGGRYERCTSRGSGEIKHWKRTQIVFTILCTLLRPLLLAVDLLICHVPLCYSIFWSELLPSTSLYIKAAKPIIKHIGATEPVFNGFFHGIHSPYFLHFSMYHILVRRCINILYCYSRGSLLCRHFFT